MLFRLHVAAFLIHLVSFILLVVFFPNDANRKILLGQQSVSVLQNPIVYLDVNECCTFLSHLVAVIYLWDRDQRETNEFESRRRTLEYTVTAAALQLAMLFVVGDVYLHDMVFVCGINLCLQYLGYIIDTEDVLDKFMIGFVLLFIQMFYVTLHTMSFDVDPFVYITTVVYIVLYSCFGIIKYVNYVYDTKEREDVQYVILSVTTKISLSWMTVGNIYLIQGEEGWIAAQIILLVLAAIGLIATFLWRNDPYSQV